MALSASWTEKLVNQFKNKLFVISFQNLHKLRYPNGEKRFTLKETGQVEARHIESRVSPGNLSLRKGQVQADDFKFL